MKELKKNLAAVSDLTFEATERGKKLIQIETSTISGPVVNHLFMIDLQVSEFIGFSVVQLRY
jgi:hypothetical protein